MNFIDLVKMQLMKMSELEKDEWILTQAKLLSENREEGFLLSLSGEKKSIDMPTVAEIDEFCERADNNEIYFEFESHYYEFDDNGEYMDNWKSWHNDCCGAIPFMERVFEGCHELFLLGEYQSVANILGRVCELKFPVNNAADTEVSLEDYVENFFTIADAYKEGMLSGHMNDVGEDWIRAVVKLTEGQDDRMRAEKLLKMFEHPVCRSIKPRLLEEEGITQEMFTNMIKILEQELADLELLMEKKSLEGYYFREKSKLQAMIDRKQEILLDIRVKCLKPISNNIQWKGAKLAVCWEQIKEKIQWQSWRNTCAPIKRSIWLMQTSWMHQEITRKKQPTYIMNMEETTNMYPIWNLIWSEGAKNMLH